MSNHPIRRQNLLALYAEFVAAAQKANPSDSVSGLDKAFAAHLQIANTALSSMKLGSRAIGPKLARQIEVACNKPASWLDEEHAGINNADDERDIEQFIKLARRAFMRADEAERKALINALHSSLAKHRV